jgi:hypothetical protein
MEHAAVCNGKCFAVPNAILNIFAVTNDPVQVVM